MCLCSGSWNFAFSHYGCIATSASCEQQNDLLLGARRESWGTVELGVPHVNSIVLYFGGSIFKEGKIGICDQSRKNRVIYVKEKFCIGW